MNTVQADPTSSNMQLDMDLERAAQSICSTSEDSSDSSDSESTSSRETARCATELQLARDSATEVRRRVKHARVQPTARISKGHNFKNTTAKGQSRVQYGDVYNINSCTCKDLVLRLSKHCSKQQKKSSRQQKQLEYLLNWIQSTIPRSVGGRVSVLEDALGRTWRIDIDTISSWKEFDGLLLNKFENDRGLRRVQNGKYLLRDTDDTESIVSTRRPGFMNVFKPGQSIRMSMHFSWDEVCHHGCPKCMFEQSSLAGVETECSACGFTYTPGIEEPLENIRQKPNMWCSVNFSDLQSDLQPGSDNTSLVEQIIDLPMHFKRVSIGAKTTPQFYNPFAIGDFSIPSLDNFDPVLFGDYRDSHVVTFGDSSLTGGFNEVFDPKLSDYGSYTSLFGTPQAPQHAYTFSDNNNKGYGLPEAKQEGSGELISCNSIWNQLQSNPDFQDGKFDLDALCSELRAKARCSEAGVMVDQGYVDAALRKLGTTNKTSGVSETVRENPFDPIHQHIVEQESWDNILRKLSGNAT